MHDSASTFPTGSGPASPTDKLRHLPPDVRDAFHRFKTVGDNAALDPVVSAILADFMPKRSGKSVMDLTPECRLVDDLGFDSLAITELVFFTEELFGINISNDEILQVRTVGDLRAFVLGKVGGRVASA